MFFNRIFILLLFALPAFAQVNLSLYKPKEVTVNFFDENQEKLHGFRSHITYSDRGAVLDSTLEEFADGKWQDMNRLTQIEDANGNIISSASFFWFEEKWVPVWKTLFEYSPEGRVVTKEELGFEDDQYVGSTKQTYRYDDAGRVIEIKDYMWDSTGYVPDFMKELRYDKNGTLLEQTDYALRNDPDTGNRYAAKTVCENKYDENNRLIYTKQSSVMNEEYESSYETFNTFDDQGRIVRALNVLWVEGYPPDSAKHIYEYTQTGAIGKEIESSQSEGKWAMDLTYTREYDTNGNMTLEEFGSYYEGTIDNGSKTIYTYDKKNRVTKIEVTIFESSIWFPVMEYLYSY